MLKDLMFNLSKVKIFCLGKPSKKWWEGVNLNLIFSFFLILIFPKNDQNLKTMQKVFILGLLGHFLFPFEKCLGFSMVSSLIVVKNCQIWFLELPPKKSSDFLILGRREGVKEAKKFPKFLS